MKSLKYFFFFVSALMLFSCSSSYVDVMLYHDETKVSYDKKYVVVGKEYELGVPSKFGYEFEGWYDETEQPYSDNKGMGFKDWGKNFPTELYASWKPNKYTIVLDPGDGIIDGDFSYQNYYDTDLSNLNLPVAKKENYDFVGYSKTKSINDLVTDANGVVLDERLLDNYNFDIKEDNAYLYAVYTEHNINISIYDSSLTFKYPVGTIIDSIEYDIKDGYAFEGFYFDKTCERKVEFPYTVPNEGDILYFYPKYEKATEIGLSYEPINSDKEYRVNYLGNETKLVVPDSYYGRKVTEIGKIESESLEEIIIPNTATSLLEGAFKNNVSLKTIQLSNKITVLPKEAFYNCKSLKSIKIYEGIDELGNNAFDGCEAIENIDLPITLNRIGNNVFNNMYHLKNINVDSENTTYKSIDGVLYKISGATLNLIQYPINKDNYEYCSPLDLTKISDYAFANCNLRKIDLSNSNLNSIGEESFANCTKLMMVRIKTSSNLTIDNNAFYNCGSLSTIILETNSKVKIEFNSFNEISDSVKFFMPTNLIKSYATDLLWKKYTNKIISLGTIFGDWSIIEVDGGVEIVSYMGKEKELNIPKVINGKLVVSIGEKAFIYNEYIEAVYLPESLQIIKNEAFFCTDNLEKIYICSSGVIVLDGNPFDLDNKINIFLTGSAKTFLNQYKESWNVFKDKIWTAND